MRVVRFFREWVSWASLEGEAVTSSPFDCSGVSVVDGR